MPFDEQYANKELFWLQAPVVTLGLANLYTSLKHKLLIELAFASIESAKTVPNTHALQAFDLRVLVLGPVCIRFRLRDRVCGLASTYCFVLPP